MAGLGLGLAALGRPGYLTVGHGEAVGPDRSVEGLRRRCHEVCDAAWAGGIRWFDVARSYGRGEEFLAQWLTLRGIRPDEVTVSSKWGYTYTADWRVDTAVHEVKDHSAAALARQWPETRDRLGPWLDLYQVHSATLESGVLDDPVVHRRLADLGVPVGISLSGPGQADTLRRAMGVEVDGSPLFSAVQATWNLWEMSAGPALAEAKAAGWTVIIKEALANGRLAGAAGGDDPHDPPGVRALAAALAQPWADVVLSGATTVSQLGANLVALTRVAGGTDPAPGAPGAPVRTPAEYWSERASLPWT
jgi:aryl-alcohol dehydrogenase-like predicted oxidoreductase